MAHTTTNARALIVETHAMWHDGTIDGDTFTYRRFVRNVLAERTISVHNPNVISIERKQ